MIDLHTHTDFSPDGETPIDEMISRAQELGLEAYAITEHCDCNFWYPVQHYFENTEDVVDLMMYGSGEYAVQSIAAQTEAKNRLDGRFNLLCGIELGQPLQDIDIAEKVVSDKRLDFIIGSHHQNRGENDFYFLDCPNMDINGLYSVMQTYFEEMLEMCRWGKFDVLGHLTYPLRYICGDWGIKLDMKRYEEAIREIFCTLIQSGRGIEINSSGLRQKLGCCMPDYEYIKLYRELGGEILTLGSDAHRVGDLGAGIAQAEELARSAGFEYATYFKERKPYFVRL